MKGKGGIKPAERLDTPTYDELVSIVRSHEEMIRDIYDMNEDKVKQVLDELDLLAMRNDLPISDGCGYSGTGLPLRVLHAWIIEKRDQLIGTHRG